jgi:hypothetical protein
MAIRILFLFLWQIAHAVMLVRVFALLLSSGPAMLLTATMGYR